MFRALKKDFSAWRAKRRTAKDDWAGALALLLEANRNHRDVALERQIVDLLLQAPDVSAHAQASAGHQSVACGESTAGVIPEVAFSELSVPVLQNAIEQAGYLIVRGFFESQQADMVRDCIDKAFDARANALVSAPGAADSPWYYSSPHFSGGDHVAYSQRRANQAPKRSGATRVIESPRSTLQLLELYSSRGVGDLVRGYFDEEAVIAARKWVFRLIEPIPAKRDSVGGGWHQDGQFMGEGVSALNLWVALSECGEGTAAPGIALLPKRIREILEYGTRGARMDWVVGSELVEELAQDAPIVCPRFSPGDALFFDHYSLHRSGHGANQSERRYALESWFYSRSGTAGNVVLPLM